MFSKKERYLLLLSIVVFGSSYSLPMTDYSQLNHDEPTHRTKPATTPTGELISAPLKEVSTTYIPITSLSTSTELNGRVDLISTPEQSNRPLQTTFKDVMTSSASDLTSRHYPLTNTEETVDTAAVSIYSTLPAVGHAITSVSPIGPSSDKMPIEMYKTKPSDSPELEHSDITSEIASIEAKDIVAQESKVSAILFQNVSTTTEVANSSENADDSKTSMTTTVLSDITSMLTNTKASTIPDLSQYNVAKENNTASPFYRYDFIEDVRNLFSNDPTENEIKDTQSEDVVGFKRDGKIPTEETLIVQKLDDGGYENYQEEDERRGEDKKSYDALIIPTSGEHELPSNYETPFSDWDRESEEQEHNLENIVFQTSNDSEVSALDLNKNGMQGGSWFLLLLTGNSTIVEMRQKDFAKYLKLNLAARLSLEYDQLRVNKVVLAPPRLMVNISVLPVENDNFDEEFDLNEKLFGEGEAPLHKLAETNATLLELSGEEYHVVRFVSLRSAPITIEEVVSEASTLASDKHSDVEYVIYIIVGGPCMTVIIFLLYTLYRLYMLPRRIEWPWIREKNYNVGPRHRRLDQPMAGGPLTVIYSGSFAEGNNPPSWLDGHHDRPEPFLPTSTVDNPAYGLGSLSKNALSEICDSRVTDSPRFNVRMMGCQPGHLLLPHTPVKKATNFKQNPITKGLDNPNYLT